MAEKFYTLLLIGNFLSGKLGTRSVCEDLDLHLKGRGWVVFTTSNKLNRFLRLVDMIWTIWSVRKKIDVATIDVFSGNSFFWVEISAILLNVLKIPFILILHGGNLPDFVVHYPHRVKRIFNLSSKIICPSKFLYESFITLSEDMEVVPNPIDISKYRFFCRKKSNHNFIWLRAFHYIYNPGLAIEVIRLLKTNYPDSKLLMIGPDKGDGSLLRTKMLIQEYDLNGSLRILGKIKKGEVPIWLNQGDIFLNTTNFDNTPVSVIEAMACGLCVVSTNVGGIPYLLEHEVDALLVPPDDPEAMAAAIQRILNDPELAERLSTNGRKKAEQFDWSIILPQWEVVLEQVIGKNLK